MKLLLVFLFTFSILRGNTQQAVTFPQSFMGNWKGILNWQKTGNDTLQTVNIQLTIQPADTIGQYTWHLVYGNLAADSRPYILKPAAPQKGHWLIDEKNGIVLDCYQTGNRLNNVFSTEGVTIINNYWLENEKLNIEFFSYRQTPVNTSGYGTAESPKVSSYRMGSYQKAVLERVR
jgi:hypothetical protein